MILADVTRATRAQTIYSQSFACATNAIALNASKCARIFFMSACTLSIACAKIPRHDIDANPHDQTSACMRLLNANRNLNLGVQNGRI
jgi:hypothetical protein